MRPHRRPVGEHPVDALARAELAGLLVLGLLLGARRVLQHVDLALDLPEAAHVAPLLAIAAQLVALEHAREMSQ